jgi:ribose transport system substrate-binding protein
MSRRARFAAVASVGAVGLVLALAGCGDDEEQTAAPAGNAATATPAGETAEKKGIIGVSYATVEGPWYTAVLYGMSDEAAKNGYDVTVLDAGGYQNVDKQISQLGDLVQREVNAILMAPADPNAIAPEIEKATAAGIPVIGAGEVVEGIPSVTASHCTLGKNMAEGVKEILPDKGKMAALVGPAGAFWAESRFECFKKELEGSGIEIVAEQASEQTITEGLRISEDFLQRFPDLNLVYGADDTFGVGAAQAIQEGPGCEKVQVVTAILSADAERLLEEGCIDFLVAQQVVEIGRQAVQAAVKAIDGGEVPPLTEIENVKVTPDTLGDVDMSTIRQPEGWKPSIG